MDLDLRDTFDQGFGPEPAHRPVSDRIEAGHRAVRRRRAVGTLLTVVVATVVGVGAVALLGDGPDGRPQLATDPTPTVTSSPDPAPAADAYFAADGTLVIDPSVTVVDRVDNPLGLPVPGRSVALDLRRGERETWVFLTYGGGAGDAYGSTGSFESPATTVGSFSDWVDGMVQAQSKDTDGSAGGAGPIPRNPVRFGRGATLVPVDGVTIVLQRPSPDLPESFAPPGARTAVALVEGGDGTRQWVLARDVGGFDVVKFPASKGADVEAFLAFARQQYADGAGLR